MIVVAPFLLMAIFLNLAGNSNTSQTFTPLSVVVMTRHGARAPLHGKKQEPYAEIVGLGNVTSNGKRMAFQLGTYFKEKYIETLFDGFSVFFLRPSVGLLLF